jgi:hypothetical protein
MSSLGYINLAFPQKNFLHFHMKFYVKLRFMSSFVKSACLCQVSAITECRKHFLNSPSNLESLNF